MYNSMDISPEGGNFFLPHQFYSSLKDDVVRRKEYKNVKRFYQTMKLENLGELNKICNFQDTITFCENFDQCSERLQKRFKYNPRKCNSASLFSGCVHRDKIEFLVVLPTDTEHIRVFEKTLIGGFSCVNTRLAFDTQILLDENRNEKLLFDLHINGENKQKEFQQKY